MAGSGSQLGPEIVREVIKTHATECADHVAHFVQERGVRFCPEDMAFLERLIGHHMHELAGDIEIDDDAVSPFSFYAEAIIQNSRRAMAAGHAARGGANIIPFKR
jgi:hypothetical protein